MHVRFKSINLLILNHQRNLTHTVCQVFCRDELNSDVNITPKIECDHLSPGECPKCLAPFLFGCPLTLTQGNGNLKAQAEARSRINPGTLCWLPTNCRLQSGMGAQGTGSLSLCLSSNPNPNPRQPLPLSPSRGQSLHKPRYPLLATHNLQTLIRHGCPGHWLSFSMSVFLP